MGFFAALLRRDAGLVKSFATRADRTEVRGDLTVLIADERVIHQVPTAYVVTVSSHATLLDAEQAVRTHRASAVGGATIHVEESAAPARRTARANATCAVPAEGIAFRISEGK